MKSNNLKRCNFYDTSVDLSLTRGRCLVLNLYLNLYLLYKCPEVKSTDFKSQEKRERKIGKTVGVHAVGGGGGRGGGWMCGSAERKKERPFNIDHL